MPPEQPAFVPPPEPVQAPSPVIPVDVGGGGGWLKVLLGRFVPIVGQGSAPGQPSAVSQLIGWLEREFGGRHGVSASVSSAATDTHLETLAQRLLWQIADYTLSDAAGAISHLRFNVVPRYYHRGIYWLRYAEGWMTREYRAYHAADQALAHQLYDRSIYWLRQAEGWMTREYRAYHAADQALAHQLYDRSIYWLRQAEGWLTARMDQLHAQAEADITRAKQLWDANLRAAVRTVEADVQKTSRADRAYTDQKSAAAEHQAVREVDTDVAAATAATWPILLLEVEGLTRELGAGFASVSGLLARVPTAAPATAAEAVAAGLAALPPMLRLATDCTVPSCRDLGPLRDLLHTLESAGFDAALLAWLAYMIADPQAAARDTFEVLNPLVTGTETALRDLLRIA